MTQQDIGSPNYELWQPVCRQSGSLVHCSFDVTSPEGRGINEGSVELFSGFLEDLGVCSGNIKSWSVRRFATPFYAHDPTEENWQLMFDVAWRVDLSIADATRYRACGRVGPYPGHGLDPTWIDGQGFDVAEEEDCLVIASEGPTREFAFLTESPMGGDLEVIEMRFPHATVLQGRLSLGVVNLSESVEVVHGLLHQAKVRFMTTHWFDAFQRSAWQRPADWMPTG
ncbi:hypothetical protein [Streptomyces sp. NPDC001480]|uniref:hypothetical protein n=1 Tax=Streptomyces sp. NPDC001480 TaxID=3364577 RepID=UPI0036B1A45E